MVEAVLNLLGREPSELSMPVVSADGFYAECHEDWPEIREDWDRLHASVPSATAFHTHDWQRAVAQTFGNSCRLRLLTVWDADARLVAVLPLTMRDDVLLASFGASVSDYLDPLIHPAFEEQVWPLLLQLMSKLRSRADSTVILHCIRDDSPCRRLLPAIAPVCGFAYEERVTGQTAVLALPATWEDYLASLEPHERKELRRKINKAQSKADACVSRCSATDPAEIRTALADAFALMEQAPGDKGEAVRRTLRPLLETVAPALIASGHLWLSTLKIKGRPAAVTIQFAHATGPQLYNCGFDATQKEWSPGIVLASLLIQEAIAAGAPEFDLLRGQAPYKYKFGASDRPLRMITLRKL